MFTQPSSTSNSIFFFCSFYFSKRPFNSVNLVFSANLSLPVYFCIPDFYFKYLNNSLNLGGLWKGGLLMNWCRNTNTATGEKILTFSLYSALILIRCLIPAFGKTFSKPVEDLCFNWANWRSPTAEIAGLISASFPLFSQLYSQTYMFKGDFPPVEEVIEPKQLQRGWSRSTSTRLSSNLS